MDTVQVSYGTYVFSPNPGAVTVQNRRTVVTEPLPGGGEWLTVTGQRTPKRAAAGTALGRRCRGRPAPV